MKLEKSAKRIAKRVKKGFQGYPQVSFTYVGKTAACADEVVVGYVPEEGAEGQEQRFSCEGDARTDETIQTTLVKIIERADAKTVLATDSVVVRSS